ncbi:DUF799 domain-containing protein [Ferrigenium sp. UT5]|uniref:DUF799 domain-containing protein n=1 Tax=Ferrigenium sp. UT5 TaxID=3242105 RepID=UPI003552653C
MTSFAILRLKMWAALAGVVLLTACATPVKQDYSALRAAKPASILVLPPVNSSPDVGASYSFYSQVTAPLSELGYYVLPVTLVDETFRQNGLENPAEMHTAPLPKLREIFGADAALYIEISQYGTSYTIINSESVVAASARLVDLRDGTTLWTGSASASSAEGRNNSGGLIGVLVGAVVNQIAESVSDKSHDVAGVTSSRLLGTLLPGPRSPHYGKDGL